MRSKLHKLFARAPYRHLIAPTVCFMVVGATVILVGVGTGAKAWSEAAVSSDASGKTNATSRAVASARAKLAKVAAEASKVLSDPISSASDINATSKALAIAKAELEKVLAEESAGKTGLAKILTEANALSNTVSGIPGIAAEAKSGASTASKRWAGPAGTSRPTGATNEIGGTLGRDIGKFEAGEAKVQAEVGAVTQVVQSGENVASQMEADVSTVESGWKGIGKMPKAARNAPNAGSKSSVLPGSSMQGTSNNNVFSVGKDGLNWFDHAKDHLSAKVFLGWTKSDSKPDGFSRPNTLMARGFGIGYKFSIRGVPFLFEFARQFNDFKANPASQGDNTITAKAQTSFLNLYMDFLSFVEWAQKHHPFFVTRLTPYGVIGFGKIDYSGQISQPTLQTGAISYPFKEKQATAYNVGIGIRAQINPAVSLDLDCRYLWAGRIPTTPNSTKHTVAVKGFQYMLAFTFNY